MGIKAAILALVLVFPGLHTEDATAVSVSRIQAIANLRASVCMVKIPQSGHGSGVAYAREGEWTYILTAAHVVSDVPKPFWSVFRFTTVWSWGEKDVHELAEIYAVSAENDLAILRVRNSTQPLAVLAENFPQKPGLEVMAIGYPGAQFPSVLSYGFLMTEQYVTQTHLYTQYSAATYFGNSGGPIVRFDTLEIVGIVVQYSLISQPWRGDSCLAEGLSHIHDLLRKAHLNEKEETPVK